MKFKYFSLYGCNASITVSKLLLISTLVCLVALGSCKKLTEVPAPTTSLAGTSVYNSDATATAVLSAIYGDISQAGLQSPGPLNSLSVFSGLSADELTLIVSLSDAQHQSYYQNSLSSSGVAFGAEYWPAFYSYIGRCNSAIEGLNSSKSLSPSVKQQLLGEAEFTRAYFYFYLVNLYGDVPLTLTTEYKITAKASRIPQVQVYQQVIADLRDAEQKMSSNYLDATLLNTTTDRVRPSKWAAAALLARVYLYLGNLTKDISNFKNAEQQATLLIEGSGGIFSLSPLANVFLRSSLGNNEAIWQLQPVTAGYVSNTQDGFAFIIPPTTGPGTNGNLPVYLSDKLLSSFETGDGRKTNWVNSVTFSGTTYYYPFKYKSSPNITGTGAPVTEHVMMLRLGEQYLIRSEARAQQANIAGAQADLNVIRTRAGLPNTTATDKTSLLNAIIHERRVELFTELGHRWLDLKRTGTVDVVMGSPGGACAAKGGTWNSIQELYPLPPGDIQLDPNLKQNPGY